MSSSTSTASGAARKFTFETVFDAEGTIVRDGAGFRTQFSKDELEAARAEAFEEGRKTSEREAAQTLAMLAQSMRALLDRYDLECKVMRDEAAEVALAAARRAADVALEAHGETRVVAALEAAMQTLRATPRLIVRLAPAMIGGIKSRLEDAARANGFDGALVIRGDADIRIGDVTLEWAEGAIAHDRAVAFARIEEVIQRMLAGDNPEQDYE